MAESNLRWRCLRNLWVQAEAFNDQTPQATTAHAHTPGESADICVAGATRETKDTGSIGATGDTGSLACI